MDNTNIMVTEKAKEPGDARILVIGVGGGGNNAIDRMINQKIANVEYIAINTDRQDLDKIASSPDIDPGLKITKYQLSSKKKIANNDKTGLGAGGKPEVARGLAEECKEEIEALVEGANMVFITAGMGGGTGTGAAPIIAEVTKGKGILTVAVVTKPFGWEGATRISNSKQGIDNLKGNVDTLIVIPNDKIVDIGNEDLEFDEAFYKVDEVLMQSITGLTGIIRTHKAIMNLDFADIDTVMRDKGYGHVGIGIGEGDNKVAKAIDSAKNSPLLETSIIGAKSILVNFAGNGIKLNEVTKAMEQLKAELGQENLNLFFGYVKDKSYENKVVVTLVATDLVYDSENIYTEEDENAVQAQPQKATFTAPVQPQPQEFTFTAPIQQQVQKPQVTYHQPQQNVYQQPQQNAASQPQPQSQTPNTGFTPVPDNEQGQYTIPPKPKAKRLEVPSFFRK